MPFPFKARININFQPNPFVFSCRHCSKYKRSFQPNRELKQARRRRSSENITYQLFDYSKSQRRQNVSLTLPALNWRERFGDKKKELKICRQVFTSLKQLQSRSFHVIERTRTSAKCTKTKIAPAKRAKLLFFFVK